MNASMGLWQLGGFAFTAILGTLLHFLFDWSGQKAAVGLFSAVNESIWEHMKLLYFPMALFALLQYGFCGGEVDQFWCVKLAGLLFGLALIPVLYYTYTGALGVERSWFNIAIFFIAAAAVYGLECSLFVRTPTWQLPPILCVGVILLIGAAFIVLTFVPPKWPLFADPVTGTYGLQRKNKSAGAASAAPVFLCMSMWGRGSGNFISFMTKKRRRFLFIPTNCRKPHLAV